MLFKAIKSIRMRYVRFRYRRFLRAGMGFTCGRGTNFFAKAQFSIGDKV